MERLTYRDADGTAMMKKRGSWQGEGIARLAAYEDTGLEPEEIHALQVHPDHAYADYVKQLFPIMERLEELAKADSEGRLVVLPCIEHTGFLAKPVSARSGFRPRMQSGSAKPSSSPARRPRGRLQEVLTMREILFRGKRIDNGKWIEGSYHHEKVGDYFTAVFITEPLTDGVFARHRVDPSTVGQYTGLTDKNGKRIFEGDVIKTHYANVTKADFVEEVVFHNGRFCAMYQKDGGKMWCPLADGVPHHPGDRTAYMEWCERIGTVHDNPELLEGGVANA